MLRIGFLQTVVSVVQCLHVAHRMSPESGTSLSMSIKLSPDGGICCSMSVGCRSAFSREWDRSFNVCMLQIGLSAFSREWYMLFKLCMLQIGFLQSVVYVVQYLHVADRLSPVRSIYRSMYACCKRVSPDGGIWCPIWLRVTSCRVLLFLVS